ncbi:hypothetical protein N7512_007527 [Penicillium capsulatum]|nr:hypothetical protein N7512_007527 [Penicillium capsulatum]
MPPLPALECAPDIYRTPFILRNNAKESPNSNDSDNREKFDVILFSHSMYGMKPKTKFIEQAIEMLVEDEAGIVIVFHREEALLLEGLVCHRTASFPNGSVSVADEDDTLDSFARFIVGFSIDDVKAIGTIQAEWRNVCRELSRREESQPNKLFFSCPNIMAAFNKHATALPELTLQVPLSNRNKPVKNHEARLRHPAAILRPENVQSVQKCVRWALQHGIGLSIIGGGHSGHCLWPNVVAVDMSAFKQVHVVTAESDDEECTSSSGPFVVAGGGCTTGDIVHKAMAADLTIPLGSRPSVGAGLWLQGGIGHLARLYGLACDAIVGAVLVSVESSNVFYIGHVPPHHRPAGAVCPKNEDDLLWAIRGAGTNLGIVISVTFQAHVAPSFIVRKWVVPIRDEQEATFRLGGVDYDVAKKLPINCSADAYLYWESGQLQLGVTVFESSNAGIACPSPTCTAICTILGPEEYHDTVDCVGLFDVEMYMSQMHGGHGNGKMSSFKRCLFLKDIGSMRMAKILVAAIEKRPTTFCYLHFLHSGGEAQKVAANATAFGCRDWEFACVITGVWRRDKNEAELARATACWVYDVANELLPLSTGVYGADLGADPRDAVLVAKAFGPNRARLARIKRTVDPQNVLAYACPLGSPPVGQRLIVLVTGESCAGKDYCADVWVSVFTSGTHKGLTARKVSISDVTKREYATATGADFERLLRDRTYKEQHRSELTKFFRAQVRSRPQLPKEHFLDVVSDAMDVDILFITGMRDKAPVSTFSHLVPEKRLLEVRIHVSEKVRRFRRGFNGDDEEDSGSPHTNNSGISYPAFTFQHPSFIFSNDITGDEAAKVFAKKKLLPFLAEDIQRLESMVRVVSDFPCPGITFRHVLNISQQPGGLALCASLLQAHFSGAWADVNAIVCCEAGGFIYASALASRVGIRLALVREAGKLPPPIVSVLKQKSHISSSTADNSAADEIEMGQDVISRNASVVVIDDVLASGRTLCAVLQLLEKAGLSVQDIGVMVVAEFPVHRGRELLRQKGFGGVLVQSLLVFDGT